jgi:Flp pilus assembly protein TadG
MSITQRFARSLKSFVSSQNGSTSVIFALASIPLFAAVGAAVDFSRYTAVQAEVQTALDAAALAGASARGATDAKREEIAEKNFIANLDKGLEAIVDFKAKDGTLKGNTTVEVPTSLMQLVGIKSMTVGADNQVNLISPKKAEIALVLDYSGSMGDSVRGGQKYKAMGSAAMKLMDDLDKLEKGKFKVGLVPFSHQVYVTLPGAYVLGQNAGTSWTGCTVDRLGPYNTTNAIPKANDDNTKWGQAQAVVAQDGNKTIQGWIDAQRATQCNGFASHNLKVRPLSTDISAVKGQLAKMVPYSYTHVPLGVEFGYQMLTPNGAIGGDAASFDNKEVEKYLVILTDGSQTTPAYNKTTNNLGQASIDQGESNLAALCTSAKGDGIKVISMAFDLTDKSKGAEDIKARLKTCASKPEFYFDAKDSVDISDAFKTITAEIAQNIFLSK